MFSERNSKEKHGKHPAGIRKDGMFEFFIVSRPNAHRNHCQSAATIPRQATVNHGKTLPSKNHGYSGKQGNQHWIVKQSNRPSSTTRDGNRGKTRFQWQRGPREPPVVADGRQHESPTTLFVDNLHHGMAKEWLWDIFLEYGTVEDVFVSRKIRKNKREAFGFVRYKKKKQALRAIENLHGHVIKGKPISVSMARYDKGGDTFHNIPPKKQDRSIKFPSLRDGRRYDEVVRGKQHKRHTVTKMKNHTEKRVDSSTRKANAVNGIGEGKIPKLTLRISENVTMKGKLKTAIVAEYGENTSPKQAADMVEDADVKCVCASSLTPLSLILFFDSEEDVKRASDISSPLWKSFKTLRRWSDEVECMERVAYLECYGINPKYWNTENIMKIGELWGNVLYMDNIAKGVNSLTYARLLVRTNAKFRVDTCINLACGTEFCEVWVIEKACGDCCCFEGQNLCASGHLHERESGDPAHIEGTAMNPGEGLCGPREETLKTRTEVSGQQLMQVDFIDPIMLELTRKIDPCDTVDRKFLWENDFEGHVEGYVEYGGEHSEYMSNGDAQLSEDSQSSSEEDTPLEALSCESLVQQTCMEGTDPLIVEKLYVSAPDLTHQMFDPILSTELQTPQAISQNGMGSEMRISGSTKRPRGRPKKRVKETDYELAIVPWEANEAKLTWETAKTVGVSSNHEETMVSTIRKSKRLQLMGNDIE
ncbi:unnamed protein product [Amaranthus hypochondriacus]